MERDEDEQPLAALRHLTPLPLYRHIWTAEQMQNGGSTEPARAVGTASGRLAMNPPSTEELWRHGTREGVTAVSRFHLPARAPARRAPPHPPSAALSQKLRLPSALKAQFL